MSWVEVLPFRRALGPIDSQNWWIAMVIMSLNSLKTRNLFQVIVT